MKLKVCGLRMRTNRQKGEGKRSCVEGKHSQALKVRSARNVTRSQILFDLKVYHFETFSNNVIHFKLILFKEKCV